MPRVLIRKKDKNHKIWFLRADIHQATPFQARDQTIITAISHIGMPV